jgi:hypothetical protein
MALTDRILAAWRGLTQERSFPSLSIDEWAAMFGPYGLDFAGGFPFYQTLAGDREVIDSNFEGYVNQIYRTNGIVFACMMVRLAIFTEARFQFRQLRNGRPGDLFGTSALSILEHPWPNGTTGDLLARAIQDADLAGNCFLVRRPGRIKRLRPDWMTIILGSENDPSIDAWDVDADVLGYLYHPGGLRAGREPQTFLANQIAHFAPIPDPLATYRGMSWLTPIIREVMADGAATTHKLKFFENGATPNMVVTLDPSISGEKFKDWVDLFDADHKGLVNAYKTIYLGAGAKAEVVGADLQQLDFKLTQGAGETRIAAAAGVHPVIVGLSEGLAGSSLNQGNFGAARRLVADRTMRPLWRNIAGSLETIVPPPGSSQLWYDTRDIAFLREDSKDAADIQFVKAQTIRQLLDGGFTSASAVKAVESDDMGLLEHTGLFSVQLQAPGSTKMPAGEVPGEIPVSGNGTKPETIPPGDVSTKPIAPVGGNGSKP